MLKAAAAPARRSSAVPRGATTQRQRPAARTLVLLVRIRTCVLGTGTAAPLGSRSVGRLIVIILRQRCVVPRRPPTARRDMTVLRAGTAVPLGKCSVGRMIVMIPRLRYVVPRRPPTARRDMLVLRADTAAQ